MLDESRTGQTAEHQGLVNMTERAELVGGRLRIADSTSGGVAITVVAPREGGPAERRSAG